MDASALSRAAAALERDIRALENASDSLGNWLEFWIVLVVIGVSLEVIVVVMEYRHGLKDLRRGVIHSPEKPSSRMFLTGLLGAVFVTIGVSGELGIDFAATDVHTKLRDRNRELVDLFRGSAAAANERAGNAFERASKADERSNLLELSNLKLRNDLSVADARITAEQVKLHEAQRLMAVAQKESAESQRKLNGALITRLMDRHVDIRLPESLKALPPAKAEISVVNSDAEAIVFALEIRKTLVESGWNVGSVVYLPTSPALKESVTIFNKGIEAFFGVGPPEHPAITAELLNAGKRNRVDARLVTFIVALRSRSLRRDESLEDGSFRIVVGSNMLPNGAPLPSAK
ncbi:MAG TPA: hypothetical protein VFL57_18420 [Bryobacteraceae bacterium]|nr:hypothetical protein [Bryobacteraceae bacterium]